MNTQRIISAAHELAKAKALLDTLRKEAAALNLTGHQHTVSVFISNMRDASGNSMEPKRFTLTRHDPQRSYSSVCIRGMEMMLLAAKKLYQGRISEQEEIVRELERIMADEVKEGGK